MKTIDRVLLQYAQADLAALAHRPKTYAGYGSPRAAMGARVTEEGTP